MPAPCNKSPLLKDGEYIVKEVNELNFFSLLGGNAVLGTSNKSYHSELQIAKSGNKAQIFTMFGATGAAQQRDWRYYDSESAAKKDYDSILKSKRKKGYKDIDVAQRSLGSEDAKAITKAVVLKNAEHLETKEVKSKLHQETQRLISELMGATNNFVITLLKCPLGQLTNDQIEKGRKCLYEARTSLKSNNQNIINLTNDFYALIPHNLGSGSRGQLTHLLLDSEEKILQKESDLDTLLDAKAIGASLNDNSDIDSKYKNLNAEFEYVDPTDPVFNYIDSVVQKTKADNHRQLGKIIIKNVWKIKRNAEYDNFVKRASVIAKECGSQNIPKQLESFVSSRKDVAKEHLDIYKKANVLPLFHGTRTQNIIGIVKQGLLIRPSNAILTGAMYGNAVYHGFSTKAINYSSIKQAYYGSDGRDKAYLFLNDCILGKQLIASGSHNYTNRSIEPNHSVWARGGYSGVINDEFMIYKTDQYQLRYVIEFTCK
jgi:poly [ADP-ribose] polymerase